MNRAHAHRGRCGACALVWLAVALLAYLWPWLIVWLLAGLVVAIFVGAMAGNPVPEVRIGPEHAHRPQDADAWAEPQPRARRAA